MLMALKRVGCGLALVALKRTGCDVVMSGNWDVRQATSQQVLNVTTFCMDICFQSFSPLMNRIIHRDLLKFSPCRNKPLPQLVGIDTRAPPEACPRRGSRVMQILGSTKQQ